jgi:hypothetical protein
MFLPDECPSWELMNYILCNFKLAGTVGSAGLMFSKAR